MKKIFKCVVSAILTVACISSVAISASATTVSPTPVVTNPTTVAELKSYLNTNFSSITTPMGKMTLTNDVFENTQSMFQFDYWIQTSWMCASANDDVPFNIQYSIKYTDQQKADTKEILRQTQKSIYEKVHQFFPTKKLDGGFYRGSYKYPTLKIGYQSTQFLSWNNYNYNVLNKYADTSITDFNWTPTLTDNYNFVN